MSEPKTGLALLREPFPVHQISYLPKGGVKLAYVGHAALTDRLLDADPAWQWEPLAMTPEGWPVMDPFGGMWIRLTVCGVTRLGYGDAQGKEGPNGIKEVIGDALRNAAMRFGAALDLWHKGDLHADDPPPAQPPTQLMPPAVIADWIASFGSCATVEDLAGQWDAAFASATKAGDVQAYIAFQAAVRKRKAELTKETT